MTNIAAKLFKGLWRLLRAYFFMVGVSVTSLCVLLAMVFVFGSQKGLKVFFQDKPSDSQLAMAPDEDLMVVLPLKGNVYEATMSSLPKGSQNKGGSSFKDLFTEHMPFTSTKDIITLVNKIAESHQIKGVLFYITPDFHISHDNMTDILPTFQNIAKKKPTYFFSHYYDINTYTLASTAQRVALTTGSNVSFVSNGLLIPNFYKVMNYFGVKMEIFRGGKWKGQRVFEKDTPEHVAQHNRDYVASTLAYKAQSLHTIKGETPSIETIEGWFEKTYFSHKEALAENIVTDVYTLRDFKDQLLATSPMSFVNYDEYSWDKKAKDSDEKAKDRDLKDKDNKEKEDKDTEDASVTAGEENKESTKEDQDKAAKQGSAAKKTEETSKKTSSSSGSALSRLFKKTDDDSKKRDSIGLLSYWGQVSVENHGSFAENNLSYKRVKHDVDWMLRQDHVKAVLMKIQSPGGGFLASEIIWQEIKRLNAEKPVVTYVSDLAASGGYYIATATSYLVIRPLAKVGSIGVLMMVPKITKLAQKYGYSTESYGISKLNKDLMDMSTELSESTRNLLQISADDAYDHFLQRVADFREMEKEKVHNYQAGGRLWTGLQAKGIGLVDEVGNISTALNAVKRLGKLQTNYNYPILTPKQPSALLECLENPYACLFAKEASSSTTLLSMWFPHSRLPVSQMHSQWNSTRVIIQQLNSLLEHYQPHQRMQSLLWLNLMSQESSTKP